LINTIVLVGRAGADPQIKTFESGNKIAEIRMAVNRQGRENGTEETDWFSVRFWANTAETAEKYVKKGDLFGVTGELRLEKWESNGEKHSRPVIAGKRLTLMPKSQAAAPQQKQSAEDIFSGLSDEELPF